MQPQFLWIKVMEPYWLKDALIPTLYSLSYLNLTWRPGYVAAADAASQTTFRTLIEAASGLSANKYFIVIYGFGLGSLLFGLAFIQEKGWAKWIGWALLFIGVLSLASFSRYYLGLSFLNGIVNWSYEWIYS